MKIRIVNTGLLPKNDLINILTIENMSAGIFGICYSVLTWDGVTKGLNLSTAAITKTAFKLIEDGHATTFLWKRSSGTLIMTGIGDDGWVFNNTDDWARNTSSASTYIYYVNIDEDFLSRYSQIRKKLEKRKVEYAAFQPNFGGETNYQNCVSHSHALMHELGVGSILLSRGFWSPSVSNWINWLSAFAPRSVGRFKWRYAFLPNVNTHIP